MNLIYLSWKNIINKPLSMILTLVLFGLGVGLISLLFLLDKQLQENFEKNLARIDLVIGAKGSPLQLILSSMYHIDAPTGNISVEDARPFLNPSHPLIEQSVPLSLGDSYRGYRIIGTESDFLGLYDAEIEEGKIWERNYETTIGASVAKKLNLELGDHFESSHGLEGEEDLGHEEADFFTVVGILKPTGSVIDQLILTTTQSFWLVHGQVKIEGGESEGEGEVEDEVEVDDEHGHDHETGHGEKPASIFEEEGEMDITSILIKFRGRNYQALNMQRNINENTELQAATPAIEINRLFSLMDTGEKAIRILALVITIVSGLSIFISLFSSLKDRQYELALLRVMGATPPKLFFMIIWEGLILSVLGFAAGLLLSHVGMEFLANLMEDAYRYTFTGMQLLKEEIYLLAGSLLIGFIAATIPAMKASRTDIAETLTRV